jgi:hypothetical protein
LPTAGATTASMAIDLTDAPTSAASALASASKPAPAACAESERTGAATAVASPPDDPLQQSPPTIVFTGLKGDAMKQAVAAATSLGASILNDSDSTPRLDDAQNFLRGMTHLVAAPKCKTLKSLAAHARGVWICPLNWLTISETEECFVPCAEARSECTRSARLFVGLRV